MWNIGILENINVTNSDGDIIIQSNTNYIYEITNPVFNFTNAKEIFFPFIVSEGFYSNGWRIINVSDEKIIDCKIDPVSDDQIGSLMLIPPVHKISDDDFIIRLHNLDFGNKVPVRSSNKWTLICLTNETKFDVINPSKNMCVFIYSVRSNICNLTCNFNKTKFIDIYNNLISMDVDNRDHESMIIDLENQIMELEIQIDYHNNEISKQNVLHLCKNLVTIPPLTTILPTLNLLKKFFIVLKGYYPDLNNMNLIEEDLKLLYRLINFDNIKIVNDTEATVTGVVGKNTPIKIYEYNDDVDREQYTNFINKIKQNPGMECVNSKMYKYSNVEFKNDQYQVLYNDSVCYGIHNQNSTANDNYITLKDVTILIQC